MLKVRNESFDRLDNDKEESEMSKSPNHEEEMIVDDEPVVEEDEIIIRE
jgi:hypothetical protein